MSGGVEQRQRQAAGPAAEPPDARGLQPVLVLALAIGSAAVLAVGLLAALGELVPDDFFDPGAVVRYGLPAAETVRNLAAALTIGLLVIGTWCVTPESADREGRLGPMRQSMTALAARAGALWVVSGLAALLLTAAEVSGTALTRPGFGGLFTSFVFQVDLGRALGASLLLAGTATTIAALADRLTGAAWAGVLAVIALLPIALTGHAAGSANHMNAADSLAFHLVSASVWVGGLMALLLAGRRLGDQLPVVVARYSRLAGWCFVVVVASGVANAVLRLNSPADLASPYGALLIAKTVALVLLGSAGLLHRRRTIPRLNSDRPPWLRLAAAEVVVMGLTFGLAGALSRTAPPAAATDVDPRSLLLGFPAPDLPVRYLTAFYPDLLWLGFAAAAIGLYAAGVVRMYRRGDGWPVHRIIFWALGCLLLIWTTSGGVAVYGRLSFSVHMVQHMTLMVLTPLALVFGAPMTLALRTVRARRDGSFGVRETLLAALHSRAARVIANPAVAAVIFIGGLVVFYYSSLFELALFTHTGHVLMTAHFLFVGYLFIWSLVGPDPGPRRPDYPFRLLILLLSLAFHAFFGIALMSGTTILAADWWHALGYTDDARLVADQQAGGGIAWAFGDLPALLIGIALIVGWVKSDTRRARQLDRQADRDGDAELQAYNERLAALARREQRE